jgi:2-polyprenyl-3-methyl-5-hydroxy-6-metoxy-1,4-benzoquinol methylase
MRRIPEELLHTMAASLADEDRDEMAIPSYLHPNPALRWMAWRRVEIVAAFLAEIGPGLDANACIMDFGCGSGVLFEEASRYATSVLGVDLVLDAARLLVEHWKLERVRLFTPPEAEREVPAESVDVAIAAEVLEHIDPPQATLAFLHRRLKPGGRLLVCLPTENALYRFGRRLAGFHGHYHESNAAALHPQILAAGFERTRLRKIPAAGPLSIYWASVYRRVPVQ